jgi:GNAT superfamily N-acetyltransferase
VRLDRIQSADIKGCDFDCGTPALNEYFARFALGNDRINVGRTYVLRNGEDISLPKILGFATLSMASVGAGDLSDEFREKLRLPRYPMPVALLGRFAVDKRAQGRRLGEQMLMDLFHVILELVEKVGCLGIIVDAKNETAISFYGKYGFQQLPNQNEQFPRRLFIALQTVKDAG